MFNRGHSDHSDDFDAPCNDDVKGNDPFERNRFAEPASRNEYASSEIDEPIGEVASSIDDMLQASSQYSNIYIGSRPKIKLGIIPLTDSAPLLVAKEKGFFQKQGINVTLSREGSWASLRDKVAYGVLDGGQMLAPMPIAANLKLGSQQAASQMQETDIVVPCSLDLNGNAITLSTELYDKLIEIDPDAMSQRKTSVKALRKYISRRKSNGQPKLRFAMVYPYSTHHYELRYWLAAGGIDPDRDVELQVVPPPRMVQAMEAGRIDGFCVGEPWNSVAVSRGIGRVIITKYEIWNNSPEKVLGMRRNWMTENPSSQMALLYALLEAGQWLDDPDNRQEAAHLLCGPHLIDQPVELIESSLLGQFIYHQGDYDEPRPEFMRDFHMFYRYAAMFPFHSDGVWMMTQMIRWGQIRKPVNIQRVVQNIYMTETYRQAAHDMGIQTPKVNMKREGVHDEPWQSHGITLGADMFFDRIAFNPFKPLTYLRQMNLGRYSKSNPMDFEMQISSPKNSQNLPSSASSTSTISPTEPTYTYNDWLSKNP